MGRENGQPLIPTDTHAMKKTEHAFFYPFYIFIYLFNVAISNIKVNAQLKIKVFFENVFQDVCLVFWKSARQMSVDDAVTVFQTIIISLWPHA